MKTKPPKRPKDRIWPMLADMPPLNHWPKRPEPFTNEDSHLLQWIVERFGVGFAEADKIRNYAAVKKTITFNPETRLWTGSQFSDQPQTETTP